MQSSQVATESMPAVRADACAACGMPLADDQRYCLDCGESRVSARDALAVVPSATAERSHPVVRGSVNSVIAGVACLLLAMMVGVLIGRTRPGGKSISAAPQVITVAGGGGAGAVAPVSFPEDWPSGMHGFTVQLQALTDPAGVSAAKSAASAKGAKGVGALKSDNYTGLPAGSYIVYSGVYPKRAQADKALARLKSKFPGASVIAVNPSAAAAAGSGSAAAAGAASSKSGAANANAPAAVKQLQNLTGKDYVKKSKQLPNVIATGGAPPPVDKSKPAGGGTSFSTIG